MKIKEKVCFKCGVVKPITDFYVHPSMGDGRLNKCKECTRADVRLNYRANIDHYRAYDKERAMLPHRVALRDEYQKTESGKRSVRRSHQKYAERNPVKRRAQVAACDVRWLCSTHHAEWHRHNTPICPDQTQAAQRPKLAGRAALADRLGWIEQLAAAARAAQRRGQYCENIN